MSKTEKSANEIEGLVLKAARGGGLPLGHAEDLASAAAYLDLDGLTECPVKTGAALALPLALDAIMLGKGPQEVPCEAVVMTAYAKAAEAVMGRTLKWQETRDGVVIEAFTAPCGAPDPLGRRDVPEALLTHLEELAAKTLVPETEASREAGAGAGLTDND